MGYVEQEYWKIQNFAREHKDEQRERRRWRWRWTSDEIPKRNGKKIKTRPKKFFVYSRYADPFRMNHQTAKCLQSFPRDSRLGLSAALGRIFAIYLKCTQISSKMRKGRRIEMKKNGKNAHFQINWRLTCFVQCGRCGAARINECRMICVLDPCWWCCCCGRSTTNEQLYVFITRNFRNCHLNCMAVR